MFVDTSFFERGSNSVDEIWDDLEKEVRIGSDKLITDDGDGLEEEVKMVSTFVIVWYVGEGGVARKTDGRNSSTCIDGFPMSVSSLYSIVMSS